MRSFSWAERKFFGTSALIALCLLFFVFFEDTDILSPYLQGFIIAFVFLLLLPLLFCKWVLREPLSAMGWQAGDHLKGLFWGILLTGLALLLVFLGALQITDFREGYALPVAVESSFLWFMLYELFMVPLVLIVYETFFRGMVQTLWLSHLGLWAVALQAGFFAGLMYLSQGLGWSEAPLLLFAPFAGLIAYQARSVWYSFLASWTFVFLTDILFLTIR